MSVQNIGGVTGNAALIYTATIYHQLDQALSNPGAKPAWQGSVAPICTYQNVASKIADMEGAMGKVIPKEAVFAFSPPTAAMELLTGGRTLHPLVRESIKVTVNRYGTGYYVDRADFYGDVAGILRKMPQKLARPALKLGDVLLAAVLRNGTATPDPLVPSVNFFSANHPVSPAGANSLTYPNLYTSAGLTAAQVQRVYAGMRALKNEDGLSLNVKPDTMICPAELEPAAIQATQIEYNVYSRGDNAFTPAQSAATAAMGQNWIASTKAIKQIVVLPELTQGGASIDTTTWYLSECANPEHGGAPGLILAEDPAVEFFAQFGLNDVEVYNNDRFAAAIQKFSGAGPGLAQWIARAEQ